MTEPTGGAQDALPVDSLAGARSRRWLRLWPFVPSAFLLAGVFFIPLAIMLLYSFWQTKDFRVIRTFTLNNYALFFGTETYVRTFAKTVLMAVLVTAAGIGAAFPFAYFLVRYVGRRWQRVILLGVIVPFWTSYLVRVYAWQAILGEKGVINGILQAIGLIHEPLDVFLYNDIGVFIVLLYLYFPFAALSLYTSLERFDFTQLTAAQDLGATPFRALRRILIPQVRPGLITACIFVFIPILGEYLTPTLVGGTKGVLIGNLIYNFYRGGSVTSMAAAAFLIALVVLVLLVAFRRHLQVQDLVGRS